MSARPSRHPLCKHRPNRSRSSRRTGCPHQRFPRPRRTSSVCRTPYIPPTRLRRELERPPCPPSDRPGIDLGFGSSFYYFTCYGSSSSLEQPNCACFPMPVEGATSAQRNIADHYQHCGWTMNNGTLRLALDHATKGRHYDTVESDVVKAVVSSHATRHVGGIVKSLKKTLIIEIKCLASGMGRNPRWEDHAELSPGLTILLVSLYFFDLNAGLSQQERGREVIPERVAGEVEILEFVPLRCEDGTGEGVSGILHFADYKPLGVLNPNAAGSKVSRRSGL